MLVFSIHSFFVTLIPHRVAGNLEFIPGEQGGGQPEQGAITLQGIIANTIKQSPTMDKSDVLGLGKETQETP